MDPENELSAEDSALEAEAREMDWVPEAEYKGKPGTWKDAKAWVDYGRQVLPIVRATNDRLKAQTSAQAREIAELKQLVGTNAETMKELQAFHEAQTKTAVEQAKKDLAASLKLARESGDTEAETQILTEINALATTAKPVVPEKKEVQPVAEPPALQAWRVENPWYGIDVRKSRRVMLMGREIVEDRPELGGWMPEFYKELDKRIAAEYGSTDRPGAGKVAASNGAGGGHGARSNGRDFAALPAEAKAAAREQERDFVGEGRMYKTAKEWHDRYAEIYFKRVPA